MTIFLGRHLDALSLKVLYGQKDTTYEQSCYCHWIFNLQLLNINLDLIIIEKKKENAIKSQ